jgi:hypothetical protein
MSIDKLFILLFLNFTNNFAIIDLIHKYIFNLKFKGFIQHSSFKRRGRARNIFLARSRRKKTLRYSNIYLNIFLLYLNHK